MEAAASPELLGHSRSRDNPPEPSKPCNKFSGHKEYKSSLDELALSTLPDGSSDPIYEAKARVLNAAIQEIGMGRYQWQLFVVIGFGWASDNLWPIVTSLILAPVAQEFGVSHPPLLTLSQNIGLLFGACFWGFGCDVFGRKVGFNMTIGITAAFALVSAGSPNFVAIAVFAALWSMGVGGNLPVDSAIFLEFLPASHQYLLTVLSVFWSLAQLLVTLVAWPLLSNFTCQPHTSTCSRSKNMGWRWFMVAVGSFSMIMFLTRFLAFQLHESPKYLMGQAKDTEAVAVVHEIARRNRAHSSLTIEHLERIGSSELSGGKIGVGAKSALSRRLEQVDSSHLRALFATRELALSTSLITAIWALIGLGFPLYNAFIPYIQNERGLKFGDGSSALTYRNSLIIAAVGVPGALVGGWVVEVPRLGRKGALALASALTGIILFASTTASDSASLLGWNCAFGLASNFMYAVLYSYTPETFITKDRGTGNALTASANRIFGIMAPIVAIYSDLKSSLPVYISGGLLILAGILAILLPFESRGRASL